MTDEYAVDGDSPEMDIIDEFDNTPEGDLKQSMQEENLSDGDFDYQQGFEPQDYPTSPMRDSITKFYRDIISLLTPKKVVRVANFRPKECNNAKIFLNIADYNRVEGCDLIADYFDMRAVNEASVSMGRKGFIVTSIMTQRRIVQRQTEKSTNSKDYMGKDKGGK